MTIDVANPISVETRIQARCLLCFDTICPEKVENVTARDSAVGIWLQISEGFAHGGELLRGQVHDLLTYNFKLPIFLAQGSE
jgi:hypothetical protein